MLEKVRTGLNSVVQKRNFQTLYSESFTEKYYKTWWAKMLMLQKTAQKTLFKLENSENYRSVSFLKDGLCSVSSCSEMFFTLEILQVKTVLEFITFLGCSYCF